MNHTRHQIRATVFCAALSLLAAAPPLSAQELERFVAQNGLMVVGGAQGIEVFTRAGFGRRDYFCAAAEFAHARMGLPNSMRLRSTNRAQTSPTLPNRRSRFFTYAGETVSTWGRGIMSVGHARGMCNLSVSGSLRAPVA